MQTNNASTTRNDSGFQNRIKGIRGYFLIFILLTFSFKLSFSQDYKTILKLTDYYNLSFINWQPTDDLLLAGRDFYIGKLSPYPTYYGYVNTKWEWIIKPDYYSAQSFTEGFACVQIKGKKDYYKRYTGDKWGVINKQGKFVVQPKFDQLFPFSEGLAFAELNNKYGYIDISGAWVIEPKFDFPYNYESWEPKKNYSSFDFNESGNLDLTIRQNREKIGNCLTQLLFVDRRLNLSSFQNNVAIVKEPGDNGKFGLIDKKGNWIVKPVYDYLWFFAEELACFKLNNKWGALDFKGKVIIEPRFDRLWPFSEGLAVAKSNNKFGFVDNKGNWIIPAIYEDAGAFAEGLASVKYNGEWGFIDKMGNWNVKPQYKRVIWPFYKGIAVVDQPEYKAGFIDQKGNWILSPQFYSNGWRGGYPCVSPFINEIAFIERSSSFIQLSETKKNSIYTMPEKPPVLTITDITFKDSDGNNCIDANENCLLTFTIHNKGQGSASNVGITLSDLAENDLEFEKTKLVQHIKANSSLKVEIPIKGKLNLKEGEAQIKISFTEQFGFSPDPVELNIKTKKLAKPVLKIVDYNFTSESGNISRGQPIILKVLLQNTGQGVAGNVKIKFSLPVSNVFPNSPDNFVQEILSPGQSKEFTFEFIVNKLYTEKFVSVGIDLTEKSGLFGTNEQLKVELETQNKNKTVRIESTQTDSVVSIIPGSLTSAVDANIPTNSPNNKKTFVVITANENYAREAKVLYAANDGKIFKEYCEKTLGIPSENINYNQDATFGTMKSQIKWISDVTTAFNGEAKVIFYYAGHGMPNDSDKYAYLLPADGFSSDFETAIKLEDLYNALTANPSQSVTVFLDACFSGSTRNNEMLVNARKVNIKPKNNVLKGKMVVFSAASGEETAFPFKENHHGLFTYFLLKKLQETKGDVTYDVLSKYINENVKQQSIVVNKKSQTPQVIVSPDVKEIWKTMKLK